MDPCSSCGTVSGLNERAMWNRVSGYREKREKQGKKTVISTVPVFSQHQGWLCPKCMKSLSAYPINKFTDLKSSPKKKQEKQNPLNLWDAFH